MAVGGGGSSASTLDKLLVLTNEMSEEVQLGFLLADEAAGKS